MHNSFLNNVKIFIYAILWMIVFFTVIYFHPTNEFMSCNNDYTCRITHVYFHKFQFSKTTQLNQNSVLSYKVRHNFITLKATPISNNYYIYYDNISPFVYYFHSIYGGKEKIQNEIIRFNNYKIHPQSNYYVESKASSFNFYIYFIGFITMFILFIFTFMEDCKYKKK